MSLNRIKEEDKLLELKYVENPAVFNRFTRLTMMMIGGIIFRHCHHDERCQSIVRRECQIQFQDSDKFFSTFQPVSCSIQLQV